MNIFAFGDFNAHHIKWFKHSHVTDVVGVQTLNFSVAQSVINILMSSSSSC